MCFKLPGGGGGEGNYSRFQATGMIEWLLKSKPKKIPRPPKNPIPNLWALKISRKHLNDTTHVLAARILGQYYESSDFFEYPKKSLVLKTSHPNNTHKMFWPKKIPESKISNPKKILRSSPTLEIRSNPPPPRGGLKFPLICYYIWISYRMVIRIVTYLKPAH